MRFPQASASTRPHLRSVFSRALLAVSLAIGSAVVVFTGLAAGPNSKQRSVPEAAKETAPARRDPAKAYGKLPLSFARNRGQANRRVSFIARGPGYGLFLTSDEAVLALRAASPDRSDGDEQEPAANPLKVLRLKFVGANRKVIVEGQNESAGKLNYFIGNNPRHWHTNIPTFSQVRYRNAYPGVDLVYHGNQQQLEYDFLVAPGASPQQIRLAFTGAQKISVDSNGDLVLDTGAGEVYQHKPIAYQEVNGERREVAVKYKLEGNDVTFETGGYDQQRRLVIDPIFVFSSFLGGVSAEQGLGIAVDAQGSAYLTGSTTSTDFPVPGGPETVKAAFNDAFVVKLNAAGTALVYGTYFGGNGDDLGNAIAIDAQGNAYVVGSTGSNNLPATSDVAGNGKDSLLDGFATKISPSGSSIVYSKYLGGNNTDSAYGVAVDADGRAYVTGRTDSAIFRIPFREPRHGSPLHKSDNNGGQWTPSARNLFGSTVNSITLDPSQSNTVYAATTNGAFKSVDAGTGWNKTGISHHSAIPTNIFAVVVDPSNPAIVYLGGTDGFYKSTDGGVEYDLKETGFPTPLVRSLAIDPISPTTLYAATQQGMYKTTNSGFNNSWVAINNGLGGFIRVSQIVIDPTNPAILYIGTPLNGMFKTTNGGALWTPINSGFNPAFLGPPQVTALAIDPVNPSTLYAGCFVNSNGDIVFKTTNGGTTWTASSSGLSTMINGQPFIPNVNALAVDPVTPTTVYAGVSPGSIFKSTDGGAHWNQSNTGFPNTSATAITVNPGNSAIVYAGTAIGGDAFALRLNAAGTAAEYMFNFGGDENDEARGVALDAAGNAYMVGTTNSQNFPVENPFQPALGAFSDAFVAKLDSSGSGLVYSTYLGGGFGEQGRAIAVQGGSAYVTGQTSSPDFPLVNPFKGLLAQFDTDAFVTKVNPSGNSLGYSTFLGGLGNELGLGIAVGANGEAYVTGLTTSQDFPVLRAPQPMRTNSGNDGFVTQLNSAGSSLGYSTYLGGGNADQGNGIAVDASGNAYVVGTTSSIDFPTANAFQSSLKGTSDAFVTKVGLDADVSITKTDSRDPVMVGNNLIYTLLVANAGVDDAANVTVSDTLPNITFVSATSSQGSCAGTSTVTCNLGSLASGASATITIIVTPSSVGTLTNTATVSSSTADHLPANNSSTQQTNVSALPSIAGRVTTSIGAGVGSVNMALGGSQAANTTTAGNGFYQFADLASGGDYSVTPAKQGYVFHPQSLSFNHLTTDATGDFNAVACAFQIPANQSFPAGGGNGNVSVTANDELCPWTATSDVPWITIISGATGRGSGTVTFSVAPANISRSGTLKIAGHVFTVWQEFSSCAAFDYKKALAISNSPGGFWVVSRDFNNDGKPDLAEAEEHSIKVLLNAGGGVFNTSATIPVGGFSFNRFTAGDFNGDGKADIVSISSGGSNGFVTLSLGDGLGGFGSPVDFAAGQNPRFGDIGDFNHDGKDDLALADQQTWNVHLLLGNAASGLSPSQDAVPQNTMPGASSIVVGDYNNDHKDDLAVLASGVFIALGDGAGNFSSPEFFSSGISDNFHINKGDVDGDGNLDLLPAGNNLTVLKGDGAGHFGAPTTLLSGIQSFTHVVVADFNGDGKRDVAAANFGTADVAVFLGTTGGFAPVARYLGGISPRSLAAADFDGDGKEDLAVGDSGPFASGGGIFLLRGDGLGGFPAARDFFVFNPHESLSADFTGDGKLDLVVSNGNSTNFGNLFLLTGTGDGLFGSPTLISSDVRPRTITVLDFNLDGKPDIGVVNFDDSSKNRIKIFLNNGSGSFTQASDTLMDGFSPINYGDFNGDGKPDIVSLNSSFRLAVRLGDGAGGFGMPTVVSPPVSPLVMAVGDFNGDGKADLVFSSGTQGCGFPSDVQLQVLFGDGAGGFAAPIATAFAGSVPVMLAQDLNGDGRADLIVVNGCTQKVVVALADAAGSFVAGTEFAAGIAPQRLVVGDLSGDGKPDLVTIDNNTVQGGNTISILSGDGAGGFSSPNTVRVGNGGGPITALIDDFDENGHRDLALTDLSSNHVAIFLNSCPITQPTSTLKFNAASFSVNEGAFFANINVTRTGDTSSAASVQYATFDGSASGRSDYTPAAGTLHFAAGESSKSFPVLLTDDALVESNESLLLLLINPIGAPLGMPNSVTLSIVDNDTPGAANPIGESQFFVRQHYHDFLNREPDAGGLNFWVDQIESCGGDANCREVKRINVSAAFFLSIEFQETGYLAYRMYNAAYGETTSLNVSGPVPIIRLQDFQPDSQQIGQGVQVGIGPWQQQLEDNKTAYAVDFVQRQRFISAFPLTMTAAEFVAKLDQNTNGVLSVAEKSQLEAMLGATPADAQKRGAVVKKVAEDADLRERELNRAFVLMQYYGYLRRNPDDPQDSDFRGWKFWLDKLNQFNGNFVDAEMVKAFLVSGEYRQRFGTP